MPINLAQYEKRARMGLGMGGGASNSTSGLIQLINEHLTKNSVVIELGVNNGVSTVAFARRVKKVYAVDIILKEHTLQVLNRCSNVEYIIADSLEVVSTFEDQSVDLIYHDSCHDYDHVRKEIDAYLPKTHYAISGHDYCNKLFPDVVQAVDEKFVMPTRVYQDTSWIKVLDT